VAGLDGERGGEFVLVAHELIANAIEHGGGRGQVQVFCADGELRCRVRDHGPGLRPDAVPAQLSGLAIATAGEGGCGLWIVRELADWLHIGANGAGAIVTAAMAIGTGAKGR
jgi:anti-sigma regulatory factor (Ser/Thr protein kinase)